MYMKITSSIIVSALLLLSSGCASKQPLVTESEIYSKISDIKKLNMGLEKAQNDKLNLFAPTAFAKAQASYNVAYSLAEKQNYKKSTEIAQEGLAELSLANREALISKEIMREVTESRDLAIDAGADKLYRKKFNEIDSKLKTATSLIEKNKREDAKKYISELINEYNSIQLESLQKGIIEVAKQSSKQAKKDEADTYAPKTFALANDELALAISTVNADRNKLEEANQHARTADNLYKKASAITTIIKDFEIKKYKDEDKVLWYWEQLETINKPTGMALDITNKNYVVVDSIQSNISSMAKSLADARELNAKQQEETNKLTAIYLAKIAELSKSKDEQLNTVKQKQAEQDRIEQEKNAKYEYVNSLFNENEATAYRKGNNILISAPGFTFKIGKSELDSSNFELLNKILLAIQKFPNANIDVQGHTDSTGSALTNKNLSNERAENVKKFLVNIGKVNPLKITSKGYGDTKPLATNSTKEGRAKNRRIDIIIINK